MTFELFTRSMQTLSLNKSEYFRAEASPNGLRHPRQCEQTHRLWVPHGDSYPVHPNPHANCAELNMESRFRNQIYLCRDYAENRRRTPAIKIPWRVYYIDIEVNAERPEKYVIDQVIIGHVCFIMGLDMCWQLLHVVIYTSVHPHGQNSQQNFIRTTQMIKTNHT